MAETPNPPEVEPGYDLNARIGSITRVEVRNAIKKLKSGKAAGCEIIPPEAIKGVGMRCQDVL